jgi:hypothetical protein
MARHRVAAGSIAMGLLVAVGAQLARPLATPPLYDGVVVVAPYVYVNPPAGQPGGATGASEHLAMIGHTAPQVVAGTPEQPAQAQLVARQGSLVLPSTATSIDVRITPLDPRVDAGAPGAASILGNVYRITIVDQDGHAATAPASALVSVVLRAPSDIPGAQLGLLVQNAWQPLKSDAGFGSTFVTVATRFGDFAVIVAGTAPSSASPSPPASQALPSTGASASVAAAPTPASVVTAGSGTGGSDGPISPQVVGAVALVGLLAFIVVSSVLGTRRDGPR